MVIDWDTEVVDRKQGGMQGQRSKVVQGGERGRTRREMLVKSNGREKQGQLLGWPTMDRFSISCTLSFTYYVIVTCQSSTVCAASWHVFISVLLTDCDQMVRV